ncbi:hypothetical protein AWM75_03370 [Aerococcus urinaehominis]|uniref:Uncharacterized protein n=1 Tax=Aerococcus urinaehominis TaxID=128944 RepID=A0A109RGR3_9LACT|nr:DUF202 domain-containing protein [Aerococcus urinaehominis]AMB99099.1 hypothetical protein AWM75_03370 [Aerococcus urinaehominis]SDM03604.1 protein of unknown function [Aerococcus urinaehominis]
MSRTDDINKRQDQAIKDQEEEIQSLSDQLAKIRTDLADERTVFAFKRTLLAGERNALAWIRTGFSIGSAGFAIGTALKNTSYGHYAFAVALVLLLLAVIAFLYAWVDYLFTVRFLKDQFKEARDGARVSKRRIIWMTCFIGLLLFTVLFAYSMLLL